MTKDKKQKVKDTIKKVVNIVCYVLSVLFIGTLLISGLQSCKHAESNSADYQPQLNFRYQYTNKYAGDIEMSAEVYSTWVYTVGGNSFPDGINTGTKLLIDNNNQYLQYVYNNEIYAGNNIRINYVKNTQQNLWHVTGIYLVKHISGTTYSNVLPLVTSGNANAYGATFNAFTLYSDYRMTDNPALFEVTELDESRRFIFNKVFNYNAPQDLNLGVDYYATDGVDHASNNGWTNGGTFTPNNLTYKRYYVDLPTFTTNEQSFNRIVWEIQLDTNSALGFTHDNGNTAVWAPEDSSCYYGLYYVNTTTNTEVLVNYRNQLIVYDNVYNLPAYCYTNDTTWSNDNFRYIIFTEPLTTSQINTFTPFNNNAQNGGFTYSSDSNVFTLLASAFDAVASVLNITILPYLTIGTILFIPLIVTIIVVIVHLLKK